MTLLTTGRVGGQVYSALFLLGYIMTTRQWTGSRSGSMVVWFNKDQESHGWEIMLVRSWGEHQTPMLGACSTQIATTTTTTRKGVGPYTHKLVCYTMGCCISEYLFIISKPSPKVHFCQRLAYFQSINWNDLFRNEKSLSFLPWGTRFFCDFGGPGFRGFEDWKKKSFATEK